MWSILPKIVAVLAPLLNIIQFAPQVLRTIKRGHARGISAKTLYFTFLVEIVWLLHAYFISDIPLLVAGGMNMFFTLIIISYL